jgi:recombinational DNA repair protein (RecF pathway)
VAERIYTSYGTVLHKQGVGEASVSALILTRNYGLVRVRAQSARNSSGKLRYGLEPMTIGRYSFVRGSQSNRLIAAEADEMLGASAGFACRKAIGQITKLLLRLMPGEAFDPDIYDLVDSGFRFLAVTDPEDIAAAECAIVLSLLSRLGYLPEDTELHRLTKIPLSGQVVREIKDVRLQAVRTINQALAETGL